MSSLSAQACDERVRRPRSREQTKRPRVLVASDDGDSRRSLARELLALGYDVREVSDGADVLEALVSAADGRNGRPDVLVLDRQRSRFVGLDVLSALEGLAEIPATLVVSVLGDQSVHVTVSTFRTKRRARKLELNAVLAAVLAAACKRQADRRAGS